MITAKRSYRDGHVSVRVALKARGGWQGDDVKIEGTTDLSSAAARELAKALIEEADRADAKVAKKAESDARRAKWRERQIAAGRMNIMVLQDVFGR